MAPRAAAAALGCDGVGWDLFITEQVLGTDPKTAMSAARTELKGQEEVVVEIATLLEERKTIHQRDVNEARKKVKNRRYGIFPVKVKITSPRGETKRFTTESSNHQIQIENKLLEA